MEELGRIGDFKLYDRVRIKGSNVTGNIVEIINYSECYVEYDSQYDGEDMVIYIHDLSELEHE